MTDHKTFSWQKLLRGYHSSKTIRTKYLWGYFVPEGAISTFFGEPSVGKSTFTHSLLSAISQGKSFAGYETRQRRILCLDNENPLGVWDNEDKAMGLHLKDRNNENFVRWSIYDREPVPTLSDPALEALIKNSYAETGKRMLIVLDHWATFLPPGDSGLKTHETTAVFQRAKYLCACGATFFIIAHPTRGNAKRLYGGTDVEAKPDAIYFLSRNKDGSTKFESKARRLSKSHEFNFKAITKIVDGEETVTAFRFPSDDEAIWVSTFKDLIKKYPDKPQDYLLKKLQKRLSKISHVGKGKLYRFVKAREGKDWNAIDAPKGKKSYELKDA
jgi:hypothetical protein